MVKMLGVSSSETASFALFADYLGTGGESLQVLVPAGEVGGLAVEAEDLELADLVRPAQRALAPPN